MPKASHDSPGDRSQRLKEREMNYKILLLESEMRFQLLAERTPLGMAIVDHEGLFEYMNPTFTTLFGYSVQETPTLQACLDKVIPDVASRNMVVGLSRGQKESEAGDADPTACCGAVQRRLIAKRSFQGIFPR